MRRPFHRLILVLILLGLLVSPAPLAARHTDGMPAASVSLAQVDAAAGDQFASKSLNASSVTSSSPMTSSGLPIGPAIAAADNHHIVLEWTAPAYQIVEDTVDGRAVQRIVMADCPAVGEPGEPELPRCSTVLGIPPDAALALRIVEVESVSLGTGFHLPPQPDLAGEPDLLAELADGMPVPQQRWVQGLAYGSDAPFPAQPAAMGEPAFLRHQRLVAVSFSPVQYRPQSGELVYHSRLRLEISWGETHEPRGFVAEPVDFERLLAQELLNYEQARSWRRTTAQPLELPPVPPSPGWCVPISQEGIYKLTYQRLQAAGLPVDTMDPRTLRLLRYGEEVAIRVIGEEDGHFGSADHILFYGQPLAGNRYSDAEVYWLTYGGEAGRRMTTRDGTPGGAAPVPSSFAVTEHLEQNHVYRSEMPWCATHDHWWWEYTYPPSVPQVSYTIPTSELADESYTATLRMHMHGYTWDEQVSPDHHLQVYLNDCFLADLWFDGATELTPTWALSAGVLQDEENTVRVEALTDTSAYADVVYYDWLELERRRLFTAESDTLCWDGAAGEWEYHLDNFIEPAIHLLDISDPDDPVEIVSATVVPAGSTYSLYFADQVTATTAYRAVAAGQVLEPACITLAAPANLRDPANGADYLVITHEDFYTPAQALAGFRSGQGLRATVVDVADVYDFFAYGRRVPEALRDFLAYAYADWTAPASAYVILLGDGHYDPKNYLGYGTGEYILPYLGWVDPWLGQTAADNRYVCVSGEDALPDMHLGRLPANTPAQAQVMLDKIIAYESAPPPGEWRQQALFVADDADQAGDFAGLSDNLIADLFALPYQAERVYIGITHPYEWPSIIARNAVISAINSGLVLVNYIGHGSTWTWASERLLDNGDPPDLHNSPYLPVVLAMTCREGYYLDARNDPFHNVALAEMFLRASGKGWIASWSPTGWGVATGHHYLNEGFFQAVFLDDERRLGPATMAGKLKLWASGSSLDLLDTYLLFGDPALEMPLLETDLALDKAVAPGTPLQPGDPVTFTISLANAGPATAHHVVLTDTLSPYLAGAAVETTGITLSARPGTRYVWDVEDLVAGQAGVVTITAQMALTTPVGVRTNQARAGTSAKETDTQNNADLVTWPTIAGPPHNIGVTADPPTLPADGSSVSLILAHVVDTAGNPVADGTVVTLTTDMGTFANGHNQYVDVTSAGTVQTWLHASTTLGTAHVTAVAGTADGQVDVPFLPMEPAVVIVQAFPAAIPVTGTAVITATVQDALGHPVADGTPVLLSTLIGEIVPPVSLTAGGVVTASLHGTGDSGLALVIARSGNALGTTTVRIGPPNDLRLDLLAYPTALLADGQSQAVVTATLTWGDGRPYTETQWVSFSTTMGDIPARALSIDGYTTVSLTASTQVGRAIVLARAGRASNWIEVRMVAGPPAAIALSAAPPALPADGASLSLVRAGVTDTYGCPVADGTAVTLTTSAGTWFDGSNQFAGTTVQGAAEAYLRASTTVTTAQVIATAGPVSATLGVPFEPMAPAVVTVQALPATIPLTGTAAVTATVQDALGHPAADGTPVSLFTTLGALTPTLGSTRGGVVTATLYGTDESGLATIIAQSGDAAGVAIVQIGTTADIHLTMTLTPTILPADSQSQASAAITVTWAGGEPYTDTLWVNLLSTLGTLPSGTLAVSGTAAATLTAGTQVGTAVVTAWAAGTAEWVTVQMVSGPPAAIALSAAPPALPADGAALSLVRATVTDTYDHPVADGIAVTLTTSAGTWLDGSNQYVGTTVQGMVEAYLRASTMVTTAQVIAAAGTASTTLGVPFQPMAPAVVTVQAVPTAIPVTGTAAITATVEDALGHPVADGTPVSLFTTLGALTPTLDTTRGGVVTATLSGTAESGLATIIAQSGDATGVAIVQIGTPADLRLALAVSPTILPADGQSQASAAITVTWANGAPYTDSLWVNLLSTLGTIPTGTLALNGTATATLTASTQVGAAVVTAWAAGTADWVAVQFVPGQAACLTLTVSPASIPVGGASTVAAAAVRDAYGNKVANGTLVTFTTDLGTISPTVAATQGGQAQAVVRSGTAAGTAAILAASGPAADTATALFTPLGVFTVTLTATPTTVAADGQTPAALAAWVRDSYGNAVADGTQVEFYTNLGTLWPPQAGTVQGWATATLTSTAVGTATVQCFAGLSGDAEDSAKVHFVPGPPSVMLLTANPSRLYADGVSTATVTIYLWDGWSHPVPDGTAVTLSTSRGTITPTQVATVGGRATAVLRSGTDPGWATVHAASGPAAKDLAVEFYAERVYLPLIVR